jgi:hypothetical protein
MYLSLKGRERNFLCRENEIRQHEAKIQAWPDIFHVTKFSSDLHIFMIFRHIYFTFEQPSTSSRIEFLT